jgi:hypothetical protein
MKINIIMCGKSKTFIELIKAFTLSISELGHTVNKIYTYFPKNNIVPLIDNKGIDVNVYIGVIKNRNVLDNNVFNVFFNTEQQEYSSSPKIWKEKTSQFDLVLDMFINRPLYGASAVYCPIGWSSAFESMSKIRPAKTMNVVHIGPLIGGKNNDKIYYHNNYKNIITVKGGFGAVRDDIILRSKIHLILSRGEFYELPQLRALFSMCNKVFTLVNTHSSYGIYEPDKHFVVFDDLDVVSSYWLNKNKRREEFAVECYRDIKKNHPFTMYLEKAVKGTTLQGV